MIKQILLVGLGGGAGSAFRYLAGWLMERHLCWHAPAATFIVNVTGCFLVGLLAGLFGRVGVVNEEWRLLLITGFCGGFTTFSAFSAENVTLFQHQEYLLLSFYASGSLVAGAGAAVLGGWLSRSF